MFVPFNGHMPSNGYTNNPHSTVKFKKFCHQLFLIH